MTKELEVLAELSVAALALVAVIIFAYTVYNRSKSDTNTLGAMKITVEDINRKVGGLSSEIQATMRQLTAAVEKLELQLSKETPVIESGDSEPQTKLTKESKS